ncbi:LuxR C-terminal-related transcriptional regulator [Couchioplanes caeruleus]|nr:response regulator transcription factor [Couchioplanes caeruleus]
MARALSLPPEIAFLGHAGPDAAGITRIRRLHPDVVLVDVTPSGALGSLREVTTGLPGVRTVAIGALGTDDAVLACLEAGAAAYVTGEGDLSRLVETLHQVVRGGAVCSPSITGGLFRRLAALAHEHRGVCPAEPLTIREQQISGLLAAGLSNREIGRRLFIEVCTVKNHVHSILDKLGLSRRADAASWFVETYGVPPALAPGER